MFSPASNRRYLIGVCAMDSKSRSKPMRNILHRLTEFDIIVMGDKVILDEPPSQWPNCDLLISFFSTGFPLDKAIEYCKLRKPVCVNHLGMQKILMDRRLVLMMLDALKVPTPRRLVVSRDGGPLVPEDAQDHLRKMNITLSTEWARNNSIQQIDCDTIEVDGVRMTKPFVEKPVDGECHDIWIYFHSKDGGGTRKLFRKVANKSSEFFPEVWQIREGSYIYEEFMNVDNAEDVKAYTVADYVYAETRKSPVVDGIVQRNSDGKEMRQLCLLSDDEQTMARRVSKGFGQTVCGLDFLRVDGRSLVIDVNGWSFVKGSDEYYDKCSYFLKQTFFKMRKKRPVSTMSRDGSFENHWRLKGYFSILRHGDRTPKQKLKFHVYSQPFVNLMNGSCEEVILKSPKDLERVIVAAKAAIATEADDIAHLEQLILVLNSKMSEPGTKVQIKPQFNKDDGLLERLQVIVKWGGEFTHAGHHHTRDLGENLRNDLTIINRDVLNDVKAYSSSERRVLATSEVFLKGLLDYSELPDGLIEIRKEMLDDSNDAKEMMDEVKSRIQDLLNDEDAGPTFRALVELLKSRRQVMFRKYDTLDVNKIQDSWCCNESPQLFKERWDRLFREIVDVDSKSFDTNKISELYDSLKYDALHNRKFIETVFIDDNESSDQLRQLYHKAKALFDYVAPREYGITEQEKSDIGFLTSIQLLRQLINDIEAASISSHACVRLYFTKESHVHTLYNVIRLSFNQQVESELDYLTQITLELYERSRVFDNASEYSLRIGFSPGAHAPGLIDTKMNENHALAVCPRRWVTEHVNLDEALKLLSRKLDIQKPTQAKPRLEMRKKHGDSTAKIKI